MAPLPPLETLGIPHPASIIYLALIDIGQGTITDISEKASLYRPVVYKHVNYLLRKGLVSKVKKGKRQIYIPESPIRLLASLDESKKTADALITRLLEKYERKSSEVSISYHQGTSGIKKVFEEIARKCKRDDTIYRYESPRDYKRNARYYPEIYREKTSGQVSEVGKKTITNEKTALKRTKSLSRETKSIPAAYDPFEFNITQLIAKDQVAFIDYDSETSIIIKGKRFAEFQLKIFNLFFRKL